MPILPPPTEINDKNQCSYRGPWSLVSEWPHPATSSRCPMMLRRLHAAVAGAVSRRGMQESSISKVLCAIIPLLDVGLTHQPDLCVQVAHLYSRQRHRSSKKRCKEVPDPWIPNMSPLPGQSSLHTVWQAKNKLKSTKRKQQAENRFQKCSVFNSKIERFSPE